MKTFNRTADAKLQKISDIIGDVVNIDGRECEVFLKRQEPREGWGAVLRFEVYDTELEKTYDLFATGFQDELEFVIDIFVWSENYAASLFMKSMEIVGGFSNNVDPMSHM